MPSSTIWKPVTNDGNPSFLTDINNPRTPPVLVLEDGTRITGTLKSSHEGRHKYTFPKDVLNQENAVIEYNGQNYPLESTNQSYEGFSPENFKPRDKGSVGDAGGTAVGPGGFQTVGQYGVAPNYIGDQFPEAVQTTYDPIAGAAPTYQIIDPIQFGKQFNTYQREQIRENFNQSYGFAMDAINTEFQGLKQFLPQASNLKREQTAADNAFNQQQRTQQVNQAVPDVVSDLNRIAGDARTYASGEVPNDVVDRALELGVRSAAADVASSSGFGVNSSAARKQSDLMSARERIQLSQYGEGLLSSNAAQRTQLFLAPTSYSNAGQQVNVMPSISGSQLQQANTSELNQQTLIPGQAAFQNATQQSQFVSSLVQQTQQFNASNTLQNDQFNATNLNNFALSFFNYLNSYVNSVAGAAQTDLNTGVAIDQQNAARDEANKQKKKTQDANSTQDVITTAVGGAIIGAAIFSDSGLKENIQEVPSGLELLNKLKVVSYKYIPESIADDGGNEHIGILAQDLQTILPSSVEKHSSGYLQINPGELLYVLIKAVQELAERLPK